MVKTTLAELANKVNAKLKGDPNCKITGIAPIQSANIGQISFLNHSKYRQYLTKTKASAVILTKKDLSDCPDTCFALIVEDPYYAYAKIAEIFAGISFVEPGIHASVVIGKDTTIDESASIAANVVIGDRVTIGADTQIDANCVIGDDCQIGKESHLYAHVTLYKNVKIGENAIIHSGAIIGSDGFGFAPHDNKWHKIPQLGGVTIGDHVEIGANTTIDCGALEDTIIGSGVKLDNQIQIAHNVKIGDNTVIAGCSGVAGSTTIGKNCMIGAAAGIAGHITIADGVIISAKGTISNSIKEPGIYSSGTGFMKHADWQKSVVRFRHLDEMARRLQALEKLIASDDYSEEE